MPFIRLDASWSMADLPRGKSRRSSSFADVKDFGTNDWQSYGGTHVPTTVAQLKPWTFRDGSPQASELLGRMLIHSRERATPEIEVCAAGGTHLIFRCRMRGKSGPIAAVMELRLIPHGRDLLVQFDEYVDATAEGLWLLVNPPMPDFLVILTLPITIPLNFLIWMPLSILMRPFLSSSRAIFLGVEQNAQALRSVVVSSVADAADDLGLRGLAN